jgi:hypothetical protein
MAVGRGIERAGIDGNDLFQWASLGVKRERRLYSAGNRDGKPGKQALGAFSNQRSNGMPEGDALIRSDVSKQQPCLQVVGTQARMTTTCGFALYRRATFALAGSGAALGMVVTRAPGVAAGAGAACAGGTATGAPPGVNPKCLRTSASSLA